MKDMPLKIEEYYRVTPNTRHRAAAVPSWPLPLRASHLPLCPLHDLQMQRSRRLHDTQLGRIMQGDELNTKGKKGKKGPPNVSAG